MTLFALLAMPLFVVVLADHAGTRRLYSGVDARRFALRFGAAAAMALPVYALLSFLDRSLATSYRPIPLLLRLFAVHHLLPLAGAVGVALLILWWSNLRAARAYRRTSRIDFVDTVAALGGFLSVHAVLERLSHSADPSAYWLVLLPCMRLAAVVLVAYLLARAQDESDWLRYLVLGLLLLVPIAGAAVSYLDAIRLVALAAAGSVLLLGVAVTVLLFVDLPETRNAY